MKFSHSVLFFSLLIFPLTFLAQKYNPKPAEFGIRSKKAMNYYLDGEEYTRIRDRARAISSYKLAIAIEPLFSHAHFRIGVNAYVLKKYEEALEHLEIAYQQNPKQFGGFYIGEAYFYTGKYAEAIPHYEAFLKRDRIRKKDRVKVAMNLRHARFAVEALKNPISFEPVNLGPNVNSDRDEYLPCLNADDSYLLFTARRPEAIGGFNRQIQDYGEDFYVSEMGEDGWQAAKNLGSPINTQNNEGAASITQDGRTIFYTACSRPEGLGSCDLYYSTREGKQWSEPRNLGPNVNSETWDSQPCLSGDGKTLYFTSARQGGQGTLDIWYSEFVNGEWQAAKNLGTPVNTPGQETSPFLHADGISLYFSSNFHPGFGNKDLFITQKQADGSWSIPKNLGYPLNTQADESNIFISAKGTQGLINSDREGGYGGSDLYAFELDERIRPQSATFLRGTVKDSLTNNPLKALIRLVDVETGDTVRQIYSDKVDGRFLMSLPFNREYAAFVEAAGYLFASKNFLLKQSEEDLFFDLSILLIPIQTGSQIVLQNIFFESNKYELKQSSNAELQVLLKFMRSNPQMKIEIQGHTDNVGGDKANLQLSYQRANAVREYLIKEGVSADRILAKGYGESQPLASNETEEGRAINRRTKFKVLAL